MEKTNCVSPMRVLRFQDLPRRKDAVPSRMLHWFLAIAIVITAAALVHVWVRLQIIDLGYATAVEKQTQKKLAEKNSSLSIRLTELRSPGRIEKVARERLGMDFPKPSQVLEIDGVPAPPATLKVALP